jgi:hypothetical protein
VGNARLVFLEVFGESALVGGGVRWWAKWEQLCQLVWAGWQKLLDEVLNLCVAKGYSAASATTLQGLLAEPAFISKVIVQAAAQADAGLPFCLATYVLEAAAPMIFVAYEVMAELDETLARGIALPKMEVAATEAAAIMAAECAPLDAAITAAQAELTICTAAAAAAEAALGANMAAGALAAGAVAGGVQRQGGRAARVNYGALQNGGGANGASPPPAAAAAAPLRAAVEAAKAALSAVADSVVAAKKAKIEWKTNVGTSALL